MLFKEFGEKGRPIIVLLHGGGLSWWAYRPVIELLKNDYFIISVVIDGHGEDGATEFLSIEDSASKLIKHIDYYFGGSVFAIAGLSLGAQITVEVLSQKSGIAEYALIESALVIPIRGTAALTALNGLFYGLIKRRWFAKLQTSALSLPEAIFESYFEDSQRISKSTLTNISLSNGSYRLKDSISDSKAKALIIVGEKELGIMKKSAKMLNRKLLGSELLILPGMKHGEFSLSHPEDYVLTLKKLFNS
jgi:pimeloyl-ACP methyl ester carboxylesterase